MGYGLLFTDSTPVDRRFRGYGIPPSQARRVPQYNGYGAVMRASPAPRRAGLPIAAKGDLGAITSILVTLGMVPRNASYDTVRRVFTNWAQANGYTAEAYGTRWDDHAWQALANMARGHGRIALGWVDASGGGDEGTESSDTSPLPGTKPVGQTDSANWTNLGTSALNLGTSIVNAIAGSINPQSGAAGSYCPSGYYLSNGRCVPIPASGSGFSVSPGMVMAGVGLAALFVLTRKKG